MNPRKQNAVRLNRVDWSSSPLNRTTDDWSDKSSSDDLFGMNAHDRGGKLKQLGDWLLNSMIDIHQIYRVLIALSNKSF